MSYTIPARKDTTTSELIAIYSGFAESADSVREFERFTAFQMGRLVIIMFGCVREFTYYVAVWNGKTMVSNVMLNVVDNRVLELS